jgi:16S rRNA (cytidine1402-2'-O)-methyltransferase
MSNSLFLIPTFLGDENPEILSIHTLKAIYDLSYFVVEKERTARRFLKAIKHPTPQDQFVICELDKHQGYDNFRGYIDKNAPKNSIGLMSEAGMPCLADPGDKVVKYAHQIGMPVKPLTGSSSIILALIASGFGGQNFAFKGYLSVNEGEKIRQIKNMEKEALKETQIFIETPYRNNAFLETLIKHLKTGTYLCVACNIENEEKQQVISQPISKWKQTSYDFHKEPCVFVMRRF